MRSNSVNSARAPSSARESSEAASHFIHSPPAEVRSTARSISRCGGSRDGASSNIACSAHEAIRTSSSSSHSPPTIGRKCKSSAQPTRSCCRASPICAGAVMRWCWSRRAPVHCFASPIRRSPPRSPHYPRRTGWASCGSRAAVPARNCLRCCWIARSCSRSRPPAIRDCVEARATPRSWYGISTTCCFTSRAPKAGRPIRSADAIPIST